MLKSKSKFLLNSCACLFLCSTVAIFGLFFSQNEVNPELFRSLIAGFFWSLSISGISVLSLGMCILIVNYQASQRPSTTELVVDLEQAQSPSTLVLAKPAILQTHKYKPLREVEAEEEVQEEVQEEERIGLSPSPLTDKSRISV